jgi:hypothetical protein
VNPENKVVPVSLTIQIGRENTPIFDKIQAHTPKLPYYFGVKEKARKRASIVTALLNQNPGYRFSPVDVWTYKGEKGEKGRAVTMLSITGLFERRS